MPRPSTRRVSPSRRSSSPSRQPTSNTFAPGATISATTSRSTRDPPGLRADSAIVRSWLIRVSIGTSNARANQAGMFDAISSLHRCRKSTRLRRTLQKAAHNVEQFRLLEEERVVALVGDDLAKRNPRAPGIERVHNRTRIRGRKQPIGGKRDHAEQGGRILEGVRQHALAVRREIKIVHRTGQIEIRIGVEALNETAALVA